MLRNFDKTETTNFEIGIKSRLMNNKVQLNATAFSNGYRWTTLHYTKSRLVLELLLEMLQRQQKGLGFDLNIDCKINI
jgi:hypothetical protein